MNLKEMFDNLATLPVRTNDAAIVPTVFAHRIDGHFHPESEVTVVMLNIHTDEGVGQLKAQGMEYFLEVYLIHELLDEWKESKNNIKMAPWEAVIHYAEYDAFPYHE